MSKTASYKNLSQKALTLGQLRAAVSKALSVFADKVQASRAKLAPTISPQLAKIVALENEIKGLLESLQQSHFVEPKSQLLHNVTLGFRKEVDTLEVADNEKSIAKVIKMFGDQSVHLVVKTTLNIETLQTLPDDKLTALGIKKKVGEDKPFVRSKDGLESLVKKLGFQPTGE
jgi:hypothetical protein